MHILYIYITSIRLNDSRISLFIFSLLSDAIILFTFISSELFHYGIGGNLSLITPCQYFYQRERINPQRERDSMLVPFW